MLTKPVVVGVDGSEESLLAAEWAAMDAKRHSRPLRIVSAPAMAPRLHAFRVAPATVTATLRDASARALEEAVVPSTETVSSKEISR
jgi:nucleotide-binding universal stress UspA family protein